MKITDIEVEVKTFPLTKPYRITNRTIDSVNNCIVKLKLENGLYGLGAGSPSKFVTGETIESSMNALQPDNLSWLLNQSIYALPALTKTLQQKILNTPAAAAALDMALYDAYAKSCKLPLVDILGRAHHSLPTSITIGIKNANDAVIEAKEYVDRGFKILKVKLGENLDQDVEVMQALHNQFGNKVKIRIDMNQGYSTDDLKKFLQKIPLSNIELIEQPFIKTENKNLFQINEKIREKIALDESMISVSDMFELNCRQKSSGIANIKLMKCGGITPALQIAKLAEFADIDLMWGCMDESIISISAALHAAFACPQTKYIDLDGSFDIAQDIVTGGFILEDGELRTIERPGLGIDPNP